MKTIVNRRNSLTGVLYRDDPTIMAWDLANEPYVLGDASGEILRVRKTYHASPHPCCGAGLLPPVSETAAGARIRCLHDEAPAAKALQHGAPLRLTGESGCTAGIPPMLT